MKMVEHKSLGTVREIHFSKTKYSFINCRFEEDSSKNLKN